MTRTCLRRWPRKRLLLSGTHEQLGQSQSQRIFGMHTFKPTGILNNCQDHARHMQTRFRTWAYIYIWWILCHKTSERATRMSTKWRHIEKIWILDTGRYSGSKLTETEDCGQNREKTKKKRRFTLIGQISNLAEFEEIQNDFLVAIIVHENLQLITTSNT